MFPRSRLAGTKWLWAVTGLPHSSGGAQANPSSCFPILVSAKLLKLRGNPLGPLLLPALAPQAQPLLTWVSLVILTQCLLNSFQLDLLSKLISLVVRFLASQRGFLGL